VPDDGRRGKEQESGVRSQDRATSNERRRMTAYRRQRTGRKASEYGPRFRCYVLDFKWIDEEPGASDE